MNRADLITAIAKAYKLRVIEVFPVQKGYRNESHVLKLEDRFVNVILYKAENGILEKIHNADVSAQILAKYDLPVRVQIDERIIQIKSANFVQYGGLYNYLPGSTISWEAYTKDHLRSLGITMAKMHCVYSQVSIRNNAPSVIDECSELASRMTGYFAQTGVQKALEVKLELQAPKHMDRFVRVFNELRNATDQHLLHMDFVRGNVLFGQRTANSQYGYGSVEISGIIDFEKTAYGLAVFDVARTLAFLLIDTKYKREAEVRRYFLRSGYIKHGEVNLITHYKVGSKPINVLEVLVDFFLLHDLYKFLLHNPYEYLSSNEHYIRTVTLLKQRGRLGIA